MRLSLPTRRTRERMHAGRWARSVLQRRWPCWPPAANGDRLLFGCCWLSAGRAGLNRLRSPRADLRVGRSSGRPGRSRSAIEREQNGMTAVPGGAVRDQLQIAFADYQSLGARIDGADCVCRVGPWSGWATIFDFVRARSQRFRCEHPLRDPERCSVEDRCLQSIRCS